MPEPTIDPNVVVKPESEPTTQTPPAEGTPAVQVTSEPAPNTGAQETPPVTTEETEAKEVPITALHEERDKRQAAQAKLDLITQSLGLTFDANGQPILPQQQQQQAVTPDTNINQSQFAQELEKMWEEDPRKAVQMEMNAALTWYDSVSAGVEDQREEAREKHKDYTTYAKKVNTYIRRLPPAQRSQPGIVEMAYWLVKGQDIDGVLANQQQQQAIRVAAAGAATGMPTGTASGSAAPAGAIVLTPDQVRIAEAMNLTPEAYAAGMVKK